VAYTAVRSDPLTRARFSPSSRLRQSLHCALQLKRYLPEGA